MRRRLSKAGLITLMALGSLALWIGAPVAWLLLTRGMESDGAQFVIVIMGCLITMIVVGRLLYGLEALYAQTTDPAGQVRPRPTWLRSMSDDRRARRRLTLLEVFLVASALLALVALVTWWILLADSPNPSGPLQPL